MTREATLAELLQRMFAPDELRIFLRHTIGGRALVDDLPSPGSLGRAQYAARAAEKLIERRLLTPAFIDAWVNAREGHAAEIRQLLYDESGTAEAPASSTGAAPTEIASRATALDDTFDVFLSHNSSDKSVVLELAEALRDRGLRVWLDDWELIPGRPWQEAVEDIIQTVKTAAILVARDGLGPWEAPEMRACLHEFVRRKLPVIPVLLPGTPGRPELPLFLRQFTWVDLRQGITDAGLARLQWGITGRKP